MNCNNSNEILVLWGGGGGWPSCSKRAVVICNNSKEIFRFFEVDCNSRRGRSVMNCNKSNRLLLFFLPPGLRLPPACDKNNQEQFLGDVRVRPCFVKT